jgi:hypothetical protein
VRRRDEAELERHILRAVGGQPDLLLLRNEVGVGYPCAELHALFAAQGLGQTVDPILRRARRITYGLGVGSPDLFGALSGRAFGLELKTPTGRSSPEQERWAYAARGRGVEVVVVRSVEEAEAAIEALRRR